ncbi:MAG: DUF3486 family protein [Sphingomonadales bacterium]|nr:DUF3486 family protein [Sphingomonadales bacterium]
MAAGSDQESTRSRREGRGRLSSIDMLPEQADEAIAWANTALRERNLPQTEILRQFNAMLADHGIPSVSKGAFSRYSVRTAITVRKLEATRQITDVVVSRIPDGNRSDTMIVMTELLKHQVLSMMMDEETPDPKLLNAATLAINRISTTALREAEALRRDKKDKQADEERAAAAAAALAATERANAEAAAQVEKIASEAGLGADRIAAIRRGVLGLGV